MFSVGCGESQPLGSVIRFDVCDGGTRQRRLVQDRTLKEIANTSGVRGGVLSEEGRRWRVHI